MFVLVLTVSVALFVAEPAAAKDSGVCTLLTRLERGSSSAAKVVKTRKRTSKINDAQECTYKTNKVQKESKSRGLKVQLELTVQPVTEKLRAEVERIPSDKGQRLEGLGGEAYVTKFDYVIAISGNVAVEAKVQNYQGPSTKFRQVSESAVRTALRRLDRVSLTPPTTQTS